MKTDVSSVPPNTLRRRVNQMDRKKIEQNDISECFLWKASSNLVDWGGFTDQRTVVA